MTNYVGLELECSSPSSSLNTILIQTLSGHQEQLFKMYNLSFLGRIPMPRSPNFIRIRQQSIKVAVESEVISSVHSFPWKQQHIHPSMVHTTDNIMFLWTSKCYAYWWSKAIFILVHGVDPTAANISMVPLVPTGCCWVLHHFWNHVEHDKQTRI